MLSLKPKNFRHDADTVVILLSQTNEQTNGQQTYRVHVYMQTHHPLCVWAASLPPRECHTYYGWHISLSPTTSLCSTTAYQVPTTLFSPAKFPYFSHQLAYFPRVYSNINRYGTGSWHKQKFFARRTPEMQNKNKISSVPTELNTNFHQKICQNCTTLYMESKCFFDWSV